MFALNDKYNPCKVHLVCTSEYVYIFIYLEVYIIQDLAHKHNIISTVEIPSDNVEMNNLDLYL